RRSLFPQEKNIGGFCGAKRSLAFSIRLAPRHPSTHLGAPRHAHFYDPRENKAGKLTCKGFIIARCNAAVYEVEVWTRPNIEDP
ncbi:unnamed protein product, partial [Callosobruchus maculatus]